MQETLTKKIGCREYTSFYIGELLLGVDIQHVQEINQQVGTTKVPHAPQYVRGIVNLRGEVVTVLDLRAILGLESVEVTDKSRNVIVHSAGENIGLLVDKVADVIYTEDDIESAPANVNGVDGRFFRGVIKQGAKLLVILNIAEVSDAAMMEAVKE